MGDFKNIGRNLLRIGTELRDIKFDESNQDTTGPKAAKKIAKELLKDTANIIVGGAKGLAFHGTKGVLNAAKYGILTMTVTWDVPDALHSDYQYGKVRRKTGRALGHVKMAANLAENTLDLMKSIQESDEAPTSKLRKLERLNNIQTQIFDQTKALIGISKELKSKLSNESLHKARANNFHHQSFEVADHVCKTIALSRVLFRDIQQGNDDSMSSNRFAYSGDYEDMFREIAEEAEIKKNTEDIQVFNLPLS